MIDLIDWLKLGACGVGRSPKRVRRMGAAKCCSDPAGAWRRQASRKFGLSEAGCVELGRLSWPSRRSKFACTMATSRWRRFFRACPSVNGDHYALAPRLRLPSRRQFAGPPRRSKRRAPRDAGVQKPAQEPSSLAQRPFRAVKAVSCSQWNGGFGRHSGPSRGNA